MNAKLYPSFKALHGRSPIPNQDYDPNGSMCQDDYEYLSGLDQYSDNPYGNIVTFAYRLDDSDMLHGGYTSPKLALQAAMKSALNNDTSIDCILVEKSGEVVWLGGWRISEPY